MADDQNNDDKGDQNGGQQGDRSGDGKEIPLADVLNRKDVQGEIDRRVTEGVKTATQKTEAAAKEAEAKLLEAEAQKSASKKGDFEKLLDIERAKVADIQKELAETREKTAAAVRDSSIGKLLDEAGITSAGERAPFLTSSLPVEEIGIQITAFAENRKEVIADETARGLRLPTPPSGSSAQKTGATGLVARIAQAEAEGKFKTALALKRELRAQGS